jgi:SAM-dependent methyltransferase
VAEGVKPSTSTAVAKDLQFYWSPAEVVARALDFAGISTREAYSYGREMPSYRVLEPSCGDGRFLDELRARNCRALGIEYHPGRANEARAKGHSVLTANFLEQPATGDFDKVVMNPPFYGRHYAQHVRHAYKFLAPGGTLVAVLPATAHYDHAELEGEWRDLPVGSFSEAGTNVPTGLLRMTKRAA